MNFVWIDVKDILKIYDLICWWREDELRERELLYIWVELYEDINLVMKWCDKIYNEKSWEIYDD